MINKGLPYIPSMIEIVAAADFFDQMGDFESTALLDEYIERTAEYSNDIVKLAGFWANVWKRMKGKAKTWFYSEYKELYNAAKEAQEKIQERVDEAEKVISELKKDVKNHDLQDWRIKLDKLKILNTKDITKPFDVIYGRFLSYIMKFKDQQEKEEKEPEYLTPSEKVERMTGGGIQDDVKWLPVDRTEGQQKIFVSSDETMVRIDRERAPHYTRLMRPIKGKPSDYRKLQEDTRLNVMKAVFGDSIWRIIKEDEKYTYYKEVSESTEELKTPVESKVEKKLVVPEKSEPPKGKGFPPAMLPPIPAGPTKKKTEPATDILTDEEEALEKELANRPEQKLTTPEVESGSLEAEPIEVSEVAPESPSKSTETPKKESPEISKRRRRAEYVWAEIVNGKDLEKAKKKTPGVRLFTYLQKGSINKNHKELKEDNDGKIIYLLEKQGPEAKKHNKKTQLNLTTKEKTASKRQLRISKLVSLMSK